MITLSILTRRLSLAATMIFMLLLVNCSESDDEDVVIGDENTAELTFGIRHDLSLDDYEEIASNISPYDTDEYPDFSPIICFNYSDDGSDDKDSYATGTLVSEFWVLTAGHNFFSSDEQSSPTLVSGIDVLVGLDPNNPDAEHEVEKIVFHPTWLEDDDLFTTANDLALVKLKTPITNITPALINDEEVESIGIIIWYAGFGDYSNQPGQDPDLISKMHAIQNTLDRTSTGILSQSSAGTYLGGLLAFDFDSPNGNVNTLGDDRTTEEENLLGGSTTSSAIALPFEASTVPGDSGGPLMMKLDGMWKVCGVLSGAAESALPDHEGSNYGEIDVFIRTATAYDWISAVITE